MPGGRDTDRGLPSRVEGRLKFALQTFIKRSIGAGANTLIVNRVEQQRGLIEKIKQKCKDSDDEHEDLQRNLPEGAHQQGRPSVVHRFRGENRVLADRSEVDNSGKGRKHARPEV